MSESIAKDGPYSNPFEANFWYHFFGLVVGRKPYDEFKELGSSSQDAIY
jgi:hypothetical protein